MAAVPREVDRMRLYCLDGRSPYKRTLGEIRAHAMSVLGKGEDAEVWLGDGAIGRIERYDDEMLGKADHEGEAGLMDRYGKGDTGL